MLKCTVLVSISQTRINPSEFVRMENILLGCLGTGVLYLIVQGYIIGTGDVLVLASLKDDVLINDKVLTVLLDNYICSQGSTLLRFGLVGSLFSWCKCKICFQVLRLYQIRKNLFKF